MNVLPESRIPPAELQNKFNRNEGGYPARMKELRRENSYDKPASHRSNQARGARSKIDKFFDANQLVMVVHYFQNPDGSLGGSGKYDPKKLVVDGVMYWTDGSD